VLDQGAAVHDQGETGVVGDPAGALARDAQLEPQAASAGGDGVAGMILAELGAAEHVDELDRAGGGDRVDDLHVWRLGPGHMSAVVSIATDDPARDSRYYHRLLQRFKGLSHVTVEVMPAARAA